MATLTQTAADVVAQAGAIKRTVVAGATIDAGMPVFKDTSDDNKYKPTQCDDLLTALVNGIALNSASDDQPLVIQEAGDIDLGGTLVPGEPLFASASTAGDIIDDFTDYAGSGNFPVLIGINYSTSICRLALRASGVEL